MKKMNLRNLRILTAAIILLPFGLQRNAMAVPGTTTTLNTSASSVTSGTAVTFTATVLAVSTPVTPGLVTFCDATATYCEGPAVLGSAQLSATGTASIKLMLGVGSHSVKAVFSGAPFLGASVSSAKSVTVTGSLPTSTQISSSGSAGAYALSASVSYHGLSGPGTGESVSFLDTTNSNYSLGTATLSAVSAPTYAFITLPSSPFASGSFPVAEAIADFNGDGIPDLAVANYTTNTVSVFLGDGHGGFTAMAGSPFSVDNGPTALAVADVNNDGRPDLIGANSNSGDVSILLGTSSGGLIFGGNITAGSGPQAIAIGDFNRDGNADIAVANLLGSTITVLLGDGTGNFTNASAVTAYTGGNPNAIVTADFNSDGNADLAIANLSDGTVSVLLGDGHGGFTSMSGSPFATLSYPSSLAVGDFNNDGVPDLAVASGTANAVAIMLNSGTAFSSPAGSPFSTGLNPSGVVVSDFNGDGKQDLAISNGDDGTVTILLGNGTGVFTPASQSPLLNFSSPSAIAVADLNADGTPDLAVSNLGVSKISIRPLQISQIATATLTPAISIPGGGTHLVESSYAGDSSYAASVSGTLSLTASPIKTTTALNVSPATTVQYRQVDQLTASITPSTSANYTAGGTVTFLDGSTALNTTPITISNGQALLSVNTLAVGPHNLTASYTGDTNFAASISAPATVVTVTRANTTTTLVSSSPSATPGTPVTFTATVVAATSGVPTGQVNFFDGSTQIGSQPLNGTGTAAMTTSSLTPGSHTITATYVGDTNYAGSATTQSVTEVITDFSISSVTNSQTVIPGRSVGYMLSITPIGGSFTGAITFQVSGLPAGATASFSPSTVTPGSNVASTTMTVTVPRTRAMVSSHDAPVLAAIFGLLLLPLATRRSRKLLRRHLAVALVLFAGVAALTAMTGCQTGDGVLGQPVANYNLTITATSGTVSHTTTVNLNVQ